MLDTKTPANKYDELYIQLAETIENFSGLDEIIYDNSDPAQHQIIKTAEILLNKEIFSPSVVGC
jgi:hypothetical protein